MKTQTPSLELYHFPVMLNEIIKISSPITGGDFVDCTFGGGGYTEALLNYPKTRVIGIDRDKTVAVVAKKIKKKFKNRFKFYQLKFSQVDTVLKNNADVIIFDLGLSSIQLSDLRRGFSFKSNEFLDMAMGLSDISAQDAINNLTELQLKLIIKILGEEKEASKIAKNIVKARTEKKITQVNDLVKIIENSKKKNFSSKINPCTKTFQALRIFVNKEITELMNGMINATKILKPGGKILVVSFHSIEDKIVKYFFSNFSENKSRPSRYLPLNETNNTALFEKYINKIIRPSKKEIELNKPSRSAKLRFATRSKNKFFYPTSLFQKFNKYLTVEEINV
mgnify:FL=1